MINLGANSDLIGYFAALEYLRNTHYMASNPNIISPPPPDLKSTWSYRGEIKFRLYDAIMRRVVIDLVRKHPILVAEQILKNPARTFMVVVSAFAKAKTLGWIVLVALSGLTVATVQWHLGHTPRTNSVLVTVSLVAVGVPFAALIDILAYARPYSISDLLLSLLILFQISVWAAATSVINAWNNSHAFTDRKI